MNVLHFLALPDLSYRLRSLIALAALRCLFPARVPSQADAVVLLLPRRSGLAPAAQKAPAADLRAVQHPAIELHPLQPSPAPGHPSRLLGACDVRFPKSSPSAVDAKLAQIVQEFDGANADEVARKFGIADRELRKLLARHSPPQHRPN